MRFEDLVTAVRYEKLAFAVASAKGVVGKAKAKSPRTHWQGSIDHLRVHFHRRPLNYAIRERSEAKLLNSRYARLEKMNECKTSLLHL